MEGVTSAFLQKFSPRTFNPLSAHDVDYISVTARRSLSAHDVLIVAALPSADYFVSRTRYCLALLCEKRLQQKQTLLPDECHCFIFCFYLNQKSFFLKFAINTLCLCCAYSLALACDLTEFQQKYSIVESALKILDNITRFGVYYRD